MSITTLVGYQMLVLAAYFYYYDSIPNWLKGVLTVSWFIISYFACASEKELRDRVKKLEDEVKRNSTEKGWDE